MSGKELDGLIKRLENFSIKLKNDKQLGNKILVGAGIITSKGKLTKNYKSLCISLGQV
jgi:hypothetical protein